MAARPPSASAARTGQHPLLWLPPIAGLALGLARQLWVNLHWLEADLRAAVPVASSMLDPFTEALWRMSSGRTLAELEAGGPLDLLALSGVAGWELFGPGPDSLGLTVLAYLLGTQILLFALGWRLGSPWGGVAAALALGIAPEVSAMARCWSPQVPQMFLLVAAIHLLISSRGFTRALPAAGLALVVTSGLVFSSLSTHNLLFGLSALGLATVPSLRGLALRWGPAPGALLPRWRVLLGTLLVATTCGGLAWWLHFHSAWLDYYGAELRSEAYTGMAWWRPAALSAYTRWLMAYGLGPALGSCALLGLAVFAWRGQARGELLGSLLIPLALLSLLPKKNPYYAALLYPPLLACAALGVANLARWARPLRWVAPALLCAALGWSWLSWERESKAEDGPQGRYMADGAQVFQSFRVPDLHPRRDPVDSRGIALLARGIEGPSCPEGTSFASIPARDDPHLVLGLLAHDPCIRMLPDAAGPWVEWVLVSDQVCEPGAEAELPREAQRLVWSGALEVGADTGQHPCLWLLRRPRHQ
jgi:hypothetical protein